MTPDDEKILDEVAVRDEHDTGERLTFAELEASVMGKRTVPEAIAEIRALRDAATESWRAEPSPQNPDLGNRYLRVGGLHTFRTLMRNENDARLAALAPTLADLVVEMAEALHPYVENAAPHEQLFSGEDLRNFQRADAALAKLTEVERVRAPRVAFVCQCGHEYIIGPDARLDRAVEALERITELPEGEALRAYGIARAALTEVEA